MCSPASESCELHKKVVPALMGLTNSAPISQIYYNWP